MQKYNLGFDISTFKLPLVRGPVTLSVSATISPLFDSKLICKQCPFSVHLSTIVY